MKRPSALALTFALAGLLLVGVPSVAVRPAEALAQPAPKVDAPSVKLPAEIKVAVGRLAAVSVEHVGSDVRWDVPPELDVFREYDPDAAKVKLRLIGYVAGKHRIIAVACSKEGKLSEFAVCIVIVGEPGPKPPDPPTPDGTSPFKEMGLRVLIVYETSELSKMPAKQQLILTGKTVRDYLKEKCVAEGSMKGFWMLDKDADVSQLAKHWQDAMKRERKSVPWLLVGNGRTGYEGPLPATSEEFLALVKKHAE